MRGSLRRSGCHHPSRLAQCMFHRTRRYFITKLVDRFFQRLRIKPLARFDGELLRREVDGARLDTRQLGSAGLNPAHTGSAGHALYGNGQRFGDTGMGMPRVLVHEMRSFRIRM
ncbi:hypothetical protein D3C71_312070 [compost metagenome]